MVVKIINPLTGKPINIDGSTAKKLLSMHLGKKIKLDRKTLNILKKQQKGGLGEIEIKEMQLKVASTYKSLIEHLSDENGNLVWHKMITETEADDDDATLEEIKQINLLLKTIDESEIVYGRGGMIGGETDELIESCLKKVKEEKQRKRLREFVTKYEKIHEKCSDTDGMIRMFQACSVRIFRQLFSFSTTRSPDDLKKDAYKVIPYFNLDIYANKIRSSYTVNNWKRIVDGKTLDPSNPENISLKDCDAICISMNNTDIYMEQFFLLALQLMRNMKDTDVIYTVHRKCKQIWYFKDEPSKNEYFKKYFVKFYIPPEFQPDAVNAKHIETITKAFVDFAWPSEDNEDQRIRNLLGKFHSDKFITIYKKNKGNFGDYPEELIVACAALSTRNLTSIIRQDYITKVNFNELIKRSVTLVMSDAKVDVNDVDVAKPEAEAAKAKAEAKAKADVEAEVKPDVDADVDQTKVNADRKPKYPRAKLPPIRPREPFPTHKVNMQFPFDKSGAV